MKNLLLPIVIFINYVAIGQELFLAGQIHLDSDFGAVNSRAKLNIDTFNNDMRLAYNVSNGTLNYMFTNLNMAPADVYMSLEIARIKRIPVDRVLTVYTSNRSNGWGAIAKDLEIKPGSPEFHQLKRNGKRSKGKPKANKRKVKA